MSLFNSIKACGGERGAHQKTKAAAESGLCHLTAIPAIRSQYLFAWSQFANFCFRYKRNRFFLHRETFTEIEHRTLSDVFGGRADFNAIGSGIRNP
jgi:hypothetical protein